MKIGILTFSSAINYGAVLQAYGLKEVLREMGHEVHVVDYMPYYFKDQHRILRPGFSSLIYHSGRIEWLNYLLKRTYQQRLNGAFLRFCRENLNLIPFSSINSLDVLVLGSDQIWNPSLCGGTFDSIFFGQGLDKRIRKIAYAPSVGNLVNIKNKEAEFKRLLNNVDYISAREENLAHYISNLSESTYIPSVLDPTLLAGHRIFEKLAEKKFTNSDYILFFDFFGDKNSRKKAFDLAHKYNLDFVEPFSAKEKGDKNKLSCCSPTDFCGLIKNAKVVVTTSFHGTALSILFNRPFYAMEFEPQFNDRILSLLNSVQLTNHFILKEEEIAESSIDWNKTNRLLAQLQNNSKSFLFNALK